VALESRSIPGGISGRAEGLCLAFDEDTDRSSLPDGDPEDSLAIEHGFLVRAGVNLRL
jgi:hypothetical protein